MEFTGRIQFADESSWLTLTTESDDDVTIKVSFTQIFGGSTEVLTFTVTPNSGIVRLPAGEILRALINGGGAVVNGFFQATQGSSSCSHTFSVFPCRKFSYTDLYTAIFSTRPKTSSAYEGGKDTITFYNATMGATSAYVRFIFDNGSVSSNCSLYVPVSTRTSDLYNLDVSYDTMMSVASTKGLSASNIVRYEVWIEHSGSKSEIYSFDARRSRLPLKTYKFLGRRGTYEYIHATGKFNRSIESETRVFMTSGIEQELENDSTMNFEQNSGHVGSAGMSGFWLEFLASKERYIIEKDGSEKAIVVDEFKTSLTDRAVSSLTFKWHYANPNNTMIDKMEVALTELAISGVDTLGDASNKSEFCVVYTPSNTTQRAVSWSVVSGSDYASIDQSGLLTAKSGANGSAVRIRATSKENTSIYAEKTVTVTYVSLSIPVTGVTLNKSTLSLTAGGTETLVATVLPSRATDKSVTWQSSNKNVATVDQSGKVTAVSAGSAVIGVKTNDGGFTATCALNVAAVSGTYLRVTPTTVSLAAKSADGDVDAELTVESNQDWTVTCEADWLDLVNDSGNGDDPAFLIGTNSENTTGAVRTTSVVFTGADGTTVTVAVTQAAATAAEEPSITFHRDSIDVGSAAGSVTNTFTTTGLTELRVEASGNVTITAGPSISGYIIGFTYAANSDSVTKTATVTLTGTRADGNGTYSKSFAVTQAAGVSATTDPTWEMGATYAAAANTTGYLPKVTDKNNVGWKLASDADWIRARYSSTLGCWEFTWSANTGAERSGTVRLVSTDGSKTFATCVITQAAGSSGYKDPTWNLGETKTFEWSETQFALTVTDDDNVGWSIQSDSDWIVVTYDKSLKKWHLSFSKNTGAPRTGTVRLGVFDIKPPVTYAICEITQKGNSKEGTLSVSPATVTGRYQAANGTDLGSVTVTTDQQWTAELSGLLEHVAISPSSGTGSAVIKLTEIRGAYFDESGTLTITTFTGRSVKVNVNMKY